MTDPTPEVVHPENAEVAGSDADLFRFVDGYFARGAAPWARQLGLTLTACTPGDAHFDLPITPELVHGGGVACGQAVLAAMDSGMVYVMASLGYRADGSPIQPFLTMQLSTSFERAIPPDAGTVHFHAWATKPGRTVVYGQIDCFLPSGARAASATTTYLWLPDR